MSPQEIAQAVAETLGKENIVSATHCMTRLRLCLKEGAAVEQEALKKIPTVLGVNIAGEELQIVLGPGRAAAVAEALRALLSAPVMPSAAPSIAAPPSPAPHPVVGDGQTLREALRARNATPVKLFFKRVTNIFLPLIPAFIACGLLTGLLNIFLRFFPAAADASLVQLLSIAGSTAFYGLNLLAGWNTAKEFGGSPALGAMLAALISHPQLASVALFDAPLVPGRGGVISILLIASAGAYLEKRLHRLVPEMLDLFLTPLLVLLVTGTAALLFLQPIGGWCSEGISRLTAAAIEAAHRHAWPASHHDAHPRRTLIPPWRHRPPAHFSDGWGWAGRRCAGCICKNKKHLF